MKTLANITAGAAGSASAFFLHDLPAAAAGFATAAYMLRQLWLSFKPKKD